MGCRRRRCVLLVALLSALRLEFLFVSRDCLHRERAPLRSFRKPLCQPKRRACTKYSREHAPMAMACKYVCQQIVFVIVFEYVQFMFECGMGGSHIECKYILLDAHTQTYTHTQKPTCDRHTNGKKRPDHPTGGMRGFVRMGHINIFGYANSYMQRSRSVLLNARHMRSNRNTRLISRYTNGH